MQVRVGTYLRLSDGRRYLVVGMSCKKRCYVLQDDTGQHLKVPFKKVD